MQHSYQTGLRHSCGPPQRSVPTQLVVNMLILMTYVHSVSPDLMMHFFADQIEIPCATVSSWLFSAI